jgi:hypothetical protein
LHKVAGELNNIVNANQNANQHFYRILPESDRPSD